MTEKRTHAITIFLIKQQYRAIDAILDTAGCDPALDLEIPGAAHVQLYVSRRDPQAPKWTGLFTEFIDPRRFRIPGIGAALCLSVRGHYFVLTFGQTGRFLLRDQVWEERFGLICALNSVDPDSLRSVDVQSLDAIQSHSRIQSGEATTPDQFGLDVEQDMLRAIVGVPSNPSFGSRMTGSESLSVSVKLDLSDLPTLLSEYRKSFEKDLDPDSYDWVNNIAIVKNDQEREVVEAELNRRLAKRDFENIWLAIPEVIDWEKVSGFMYSHGRRECFQDVSMLSFLKSVAEEESISVDLLRARTVYCADADHNKTFKSWPVFKCVYAEVEVAGKKYVLNGGTWFSVAQDFVDRTNREFAKIERSKLVLPQYQGGGETGYNAAVAAAEPDRYALLDDKKKIMHGGGHGQVEVCDLFSSERELIHVKRYGKASVLSHLFSQGFVSGQLIQVDAEFRKKVKEKLPTKFRPLISVTEKPEDKSFTVVYGIVSSQPGAGLHLPFFSRVNLNNTAKVLRGFGYNVQLLKIPVDPAFAKTSKLPPGRAPKRRRGKKGAAAKAK